MRAGARDGQRRAVDVGAVGAQVLQVEGALAEVDARMVPGEVPLRIRQHPVIVRGPPQAAAAHPDHDAHRIAEELAVVAEDLEAQGHAAKILTELAEL
jgi:hypothetical protein